MSGTVDPGANIIPAPIPAPTPTPSPAPVPIPTANWYDGKASAEEVSLWQNKGWPHTDPTALALEATKAYNEAQKFIGVPHDEIVRLPKNPVAPEWAGVWDRLGVPKEASGYDLSGVKFADGSTLDPAAELAIRTAAHKAHVSVAAMPEFTAEFVKYMDGQEANDRAEATARLETERNALRQNWGTNFEVNKFVAAQGAKALGLDEAALNSLEGSAGYAKTMEALRRVGVMNGEDKYVAGSVPGNNGLMTRDQAVQRMAELKRDPAWTQKLMAGDAAAGREFSNLSLAISGPNL
jgi:hypothetical protein